MFSPSAPAKAPATVVSVSLALLLATATVVGLTMDWRIGVALAAISLGTVAYGLTEAFPFHALGAYLIIAPWVLRETEIELGAGIPNLNFERIGIYAVVAIVVMRIISGRHDRLPLTRFDKTFLIWIGAMIFSGIVMGRTPPQTFRQVVNENVYPFMIYFGMKNLITKPSQVRAIAIALMLSGFVMGFHAFLDQVAGLELGKVDKHSLDFQSQRAQIGGMHNLQGNRAGGPLGNSVILGVSLILGGVISFFAFIHERRPLMRVTAATCLVFCAIGVFVTYTRGVYTAVLMCVPLIWVWQPRFRKAILGGAFVAVLLTAIAIPIALTNPENRMLNTGSIFERFGMWVTSFHFIKESPIIGHGYGYETYPFLKTQKLVPRVDFISYHYLMANSTPHNEFLRQTITMGVVGLALFCRFLWTLAGELRSFHHDLGPMGFHEMRPWVTAAACGCIGFYGQGLFTDMTAMNYADTAVFLFLGAVLGVYENEKRRLQSGSDGLPYPQAASAPPQRRRWLRRRPPRGQRI